MITSSTVTLNAHFGKRNSTTIFVWRRFRFQSWFPFHKSLLHLRLLSCFWAQAKYLETWKTSTKWCFFFLLAAAWVPKWAMKTSTKWSMIFPSNVSDVIMGCEVPSDCLVLAKENEASWGIWPLCNPQCSVSTRWAPGCGKSSIKPWNHPEITWNGQLFMTTMPEIPTLDRSGVYR